MDRIRIGRAFWQWVGGGLIAGCVIGWLYAVAVQRAGGWEHGLAWEIVVLRATHVHLPKPLDLFLLTIPWLGTNITILPAVAIAAWTLHRRHRDDLITVIIVTALGNYVTGFFLKYVADRKRPTLFPARGEFTGPSYPSGHAMMVTSVLLVACYLLHRERGWRWPYAVAAVFALITMFSRLYLCVHWPTDLIGGAIIGGVWLTAMLGAMGARTVRFAERRHRVAHPASSVNES